MISYQINPLRSNISLGQNGSFILFLLYPLPLDFTWQSILCVVARQDFRSKLFFAKVPSNFMLLNGDIRLILTNCEMCLTFRVSLLTLLLALPTNSRMVEYMPMGHGKEEIQCSNPKVFIEGAELQMLC